MRASSAGSISACASCHPSYQIVESAFTSPASAFLTCITSRRRGAGLHLRNNIEVMNVFPSAERFIKLDSRVVPCIGLNIDYPRTYLPCDVARFIDQPRRDTSPTVILLYTEVVDVDFRSLLFELLQHVRRQGTNNAAIDNRRQRNKRVVLQTRFEISVGGDV